MAKSEKQILKESDQYWSVHELDEKRIEAIKDPVAQAHARAAYDRHLADLEQRAAE